jgi:hypothetical protein
MHANTYFEIFCSVKIRFNFLFYHWETWSYVWKQKYFFLYNNFLKTFRRKPGILIPRNIFFFSFLFLDWDWLGQPFRSGLVLSDSINCGEALYCSHAIWIVGSELIHSPLFTCRTVEGAPNWRRRRRREEKREVDLVVAVLLLTMGEEEWRWF